MKNKYRICVYDSNGQVCGYHSIIILATEQEVLDYCTKWDNAQPGYTHIPEEII